MFQIGNNDPRGFKGVLIILLTIYIPIYFERQGSRKHPLSGGCNEKSEKETHVSQDEVEGKILQKTGLGQLF